MGDGACAVAPSFSLRVTIGAFTRPRYQWCERSGFFYTSSSPIYSPEPQARFSNRTWETLTIVSVGMVKDSDPTDSFEVYPIFVPMLDEAPKDTFRRGFAIRVFWCRNRKIKAFF